MKKLDNFSNSLRVLKDADYNLANENEIYRTGVIAQFNLTFELAWKALQAVLRAHGAEGAEIGSPREILQLGYKLGFVQDSAVWLAMLKKRNASVHIYDSISIASPKEKNLYFSSTAILYAFRMCSRSYSAETSITSVLPGRWKLVINASTI